MLMLVVHNDIMIILKQPRDDFFSAILSVGRSDVRTIALVFT